MKKNLHGKKRRCKYCDKVVILRTIFGRYGWKHHEVESHMDGAGKLCPCKTKADTKPVKRKWFERK